MEDAFADREAVLNAVIALNRRGFSLAERDKVVSKCGLDRSRTLEAANWLRRRGYIDGQGAADGYLYRMRATPLGEDVVESGTSLKGLTSQSTAAQGRGDVHITNNAGGGTLNQQYGDHNQQQITIGVSPVELQDLISALREVGATDAADQVDQVTRGGTDVSGAKKALEIAVSVLSGAASMTSVGTAIAAIL